MLRSRVLKKRLKDRHALGVTQGPLTLEDRFAQGTSRLGRDLRTAPLDVEANGSCLKAAGCSSSETLLEGTEFPVLRAFCAARQASHRFFLQIAGITIAFSSDDPELKLEIEGATKKFLVANAEPHVRIKARGGDLSAESVGEKIFDSGVLWQLYSDDTSYRFHFTIPTLGPIPYRIASFNSDFTSGEVCFHHPYFSLGQPLYPLDYPLDELLLVNLLAQGRGLEIHACGVIDSRGNGHLFVGQSGSGKTTMARLWQNEPGITVLSDDRIILRKAGTSLWMYGTPWHGEADLASPDRAQLIGVYLLNKGVRNELVPLRKSDAATRLFACSFPPFYSQPGIDFTLGLLEEVVKSVPCYELTFSPDKRVLEFIAKSDR
jgi:hypothetical protein